MEALSGAAAVLQICDLGLKLGNELRIFIADYREASDRVKHINVDLSLTLEMLKKFAKVLDAPQRSGMLRDPQQRQKFDTLMKIMNDLLQRLLTLILKYNKDIKTSKSTRAKWVLKGAKEAKDLGQLLAGHNAILEITLSFMNYEQGAKILDQTYKLVRQESDLREQGEAALRQGAAIYDQNTAIFDQGSAAKQEVTESNIRLANLAFQEEATQYEVAMNSSRLEDVMTQGATIYAEAMEIMEVQMSTIEQAATNHSAALEQSANFQMHTQEKLEQIMSLLTTLHGQQSAHQGYTGANVADVQGIQEWADVIFDTAASIVSSSAGTSNIDLDSQTIVDFLNPPEQDEEMTQTERREVLMREVMKEAAIEATRLERERRAREVKFRRIKKALKLVTANNQSLHELLPLVDPTRYECKLDRPHSEPPIFDYEGFGECVKLEPKYLHNFTEIELLIEREVLSMHHQYAQEMCELSTDKCEEDKHDFYHGLAENIFEDFKEVHSEFVEAIHLPDETDEREIYEGERNDLPYDDYGRPSICVKELTFAQLMYHLMDHVGPENLFHKPVSVERPRTRAKRRNSRKVHWHP